MAGNARFHDKLHRKNHHTNPTVGFADSASDPIASPSEPFQGDFVINGKLSSNSGVNVLSANVTGDIYCNNIHISSVTYTNFISGNSTETIISDKMVSGNGDNTLTLDFETGIYAKSPFVSISNTLCSLSAITSPDATFNTLTVKTSSNLIGPLSVLGNSNLNGNLSVGNNVDIKGNVFISGNLSAMGDVSVIDTNIISTSALSVINYGQSSALVVNQIGNYPTARFQNNGTDIFVISGTKLNVYGSLSSSENINGTNINLLQNTSGDWNSVYNTVSSTSGNWNSVYNRVSSTSGNWDSVYNSVSSTSSNWDSVYNTVSSTSGNWNKSYDFLTSGGTISGSINSTGVISSSNITSLSTKIDSLCNGFNVSLSSNGYQKLPSGLIMQWGTETNSISGAITITFPIQFTNAVYSVVAVPVVDNPTGWDTVTLSGSPTLTNAVFNRLHGDGSTGFSNADFDIKYQAIGY